MDSTAVTCIKNWTDVSGIKVFCFTWNMGASVI